MEWKAFLRRLSRFTTLRILMILKFFEPPYYDLRILGPAIAKHILFNFGLVLFKCRKLLVTNIISINLKPYVIISIFSYFLFRKKVSGSKKRNSLTKLPSQ